MGAAGVEALATERGLQAVLPELRRGGVGQKPLGSAAALVHNPTTFQPHEQGLCHSAH